MVYNFLELVNRKRKMYTVAIITIVCLFFKYAHAFLKKFFSHSNIRWCPVSIYRKLTIH